MPLRDSDYSVDTLVLPSFNQLLCLACKMLYYAVRKRIAAIETPAAICLLAVFNYLEAPHIAGQVLVINHDLPNQHGGYFFGACLVQPFPALLSTHFRLAHENKAHLPTVPGTGERLGFHRDAAVIVEIQRHDDRLACHFESLLDIRYMS